MEDKLQLNALLKELRRETYSLRNRLQSIIYDNRFVSLFDEFPLVANERCGLWYVKPHQLSELAYFKSTDGHTGQWSFSYRRLNFHLLPLLGANGGIVLVDSTRKGKLMPDALLKTVPIWCAVLNYVMFGEAENNWLVTPREMVSESEHSSMVKKIPEFAAEVEKLGLITEDELVRRLGAKKPLVPCWCYPGKRSFRNLDLEFSVLCLTASKSGNSEYWPYSWQYIQGAADDHELWTHEIPNMDALVFWNDVYTDPSITDPEGNIYLVGESELVSKIGNKLSKAAGIDATALGNTGLIVGKIESDVTYLTLLLSYPEISGVLVLSAEYNITEIPEAPIQVQTFKVESSKKGSKKLRELLPSLVSNLPTKVLILCDSGKDLGVGVALCVLCKKFSISWDRLDSPQHANKDIVKQHLNKIMDYRKVNPSRNTLQSVNTFLMALRDN